MPLLDRDEFTRILFYPRREEHGIKTSGQPVSIQVAPGVCVGGYLHTPNERSPLLLFFHGNGEIAADYDFVAQAFTNLDLSFLVMDYRGYGTSDGRPSTSSLLCDAVTIFDALPVQLGRFGCCPPRVFVMGRSLGSAAALEIADRRGNRLAGLILESAFAFTQPLLERLQAPLDGYEEELDGHGNVRKISRFYGRTWVIHGSKDALISPAQALALLRHSGSAQKQLVVVEQAGHNDIFTVGYQMYFEALSAFIKND